MKNTANSSNPKSSRLQRAKVKLLASYYGHPARDLRLICITGTNGKSTVAHFVHKILEAAGQPAAILASDQHIKPSMLHKFLNDAWKAKAIYTIITAPAVSLQSETFYGLPIYTAALTDVDTSKLNEADTTNYLQAKSMLFQMNPQNIILNRDDTYYPNFSNYHGASETLTYGASSDSDLRIDRSKLYRKGSEANLILGSKAFTVASFLSGELIISQMACATAIATTLNISPSTIAEGIANLLPPEN